MTSTFIALPLTSGEAFLLRTTDEDDKEWTILVDSGKKYGEDTRELAKVLAKISPKIDRIDIAICTHSDADHSQGYWYFPDDWYDMGRTIGEFWLPGRWANAMPAILTDTAGFVAKLRHGAIEAAIVMNTAELSKEQKSISRETLYSQLADVVVNAEEVGMSGVVPVSDERAEGEASYPAGFGLNAGEIETLRADLQETDDRIDPLEEAFLLGESINGWRLGDRKIGDSPPTALQYFNVKSEANIAFAEVADTAKAIHKIATAAVMRNIRVRWFDFGEYAKTDEPKGGNKGLLEPVCAVEVVPDPRLTKNISALRLFADLRLSRQNVESLVFYRPETDRAPGVLFLGDSRLAHGIERPGKNFPIPFDNPRRKLLVTAPHHGSDNNDRAFEVVDGWLGRDAAYYVRNGGQSNQQLGDYRNRGERRCAQCVQYNGKVWNQWVAVMSSGNSWNWPPTADVCGTPKI